MPVRFRCTECGAALSVARRKIGSSVECPKCRHHIIVLPPGRKSREIDLLNEEGGAEETIDKEVLPLPSPTVMNWRTDPPPNGAGITTIGARVQNFDDDSPSPAPSVPTPSPPNREAEEPTRTMRYARCFVETGAVVGLEKVSEQYIGGDAHIEGSQSLHGSYSGRHSVFKATGHMSGFGYLLGQAALWTEYHYETRFFLRETDGFDRPISVSGRHLPLLDGHTVTVVYVNNDRERPLLCALLNHDTRQVLCTASENDLIEHLRIQRYLHVKRVLITPEERTQQLNKRNRLYRRCRPWLVLAGCIGLFLLLIGALLQAVGAGVGSMILGSGVLAITATFVLSAIIWVDLYTIRTKASHEMTRIGNPEVRDEIRAISEFVDRVAESLCL